ncbi:MULTISPECIES: hypothetical protein [Bacillus]|uniref:hypothetical protein n=1 Tax=Bacillus TaxID=1386 RepID=UPI000F784FB9|nr:MULTISPECIES: hypothetical protein [Bacillus]MDJ0287133.1 hypothetical protein [Bacillus altitudinis]
MNGIASCFPGNELLSLTIIIGIYLVITYLTLFIRRKYKHLNIPKEYKWIAALSFFLSAILTAVFMNRYNCSQWLDSILPNLIVDILLIPVTAIFITILVNNTQKKIEGREAKEEAFYTIGVQHLELTVCLSNIYFSIKGDIERIKSEDYDSKKLLHEHTNYYLNKAMEASSITTENLSVFRNDTKEILSGYIYKYISILPKDLARKIVELEGMLQKEEDYKKIGDKILDIHNYFKGFYIYY